MNNKKIVTFRLDEEKWDYYKDLARDASYRLHRDVTVTDLIHLGLHLVKPWPSGNYSEFVWASGSFYE